VHHRGLEPLAERQQLIVRARATRRAAVGRRRAGSYHMLRTPAAPAPAAIATIATNPRSGSRCRGAIINPTTAVKTASAITRGFINVKKFAKRAVERNQVGNGGRAMGIAVVFMINSLRARFATSCR